MSSRSIRIAALALIAVPAVAFTFGGWVVITVDSLPEYAVAGKPTTVTYTVRQHGMTLLGGLRPYVVARNGSGLVEAKAGETSPSHYSATLNLPRDGASVETVCDRHGRRRTDTHHQRRAEALRHPGHQRDRVARR